MTIQRSWLIAADVPLNLVDIWIDPLNVAMDQYKVNLTAARIGMFLAQISHESNGLTHVLENLNYSAQRLTEVWPHVFTTLEFSEQYEHNPEKLANFIYAGKNGNRDVESGDGWKYRGRGPIQITGLNNYTSIQNVTGIPCIDNPELLETPMYGAKSAAGYWSENGLNALADVGNFDRITLKINGGMNGSPDRHRRWANIQVAIGG